MYYNSEEYSLTFRQIDDIEEKFINFICEYIMVKPFMWNEITNKILYNARLNYVKDTTFIITTYEIKENVVKSLFELFKDLLRRGFVTKIIYKKEFMIVHLYSYLIVKTLSSANNWLIIVTYQLIKDKWQDLNPYLNVTYESRLMTGEVELIVCKNNLPIIIFSSKMENNYRLLNVKKIFLYLFESRYDINQIDWEKLKFSYNLEEFEKKIKILIN